MHLNLNNITDTKLLNCRIPEWLNHLCTSDLNHLNDGSLIRLIKGQTMGMFKVVYCQIYDMAFCHLVQNWRMGTHWVRIISWQLPGWLCSCRWWGEEWVVGGRLGGSPCLLTLRTVVWTVVWTVVSPYNLIISSVYVQTSFGAKSPRPSFYQIFWPLCLQISGANHHNRKLYLRPPDITQGTKLQPAHKYRQTTRCSNIEILKTQDISLPERGESPLAGRLYWIIFHRVRPICYQTVVFGVRCETINVINWSPAGSLS